MDPKRATIVLLADDIFSYILQYQGLDWTPPVRHYPSFLRKFKPEIALAALYFAREHKEEFDEKLTQSGEPILADRHAFFKHVYNSADHIFKGNVLLLEFITFCAFAANLVSLACGNNKEEFVSYMTEAMVVVFEEKMEPHFHVLGGWQALYKMAQQYVIYIRPKKFNSDEDEKTSAESGSTT